MTITIESEQKVPIVPPEGTPLEIQLGSDTATLSSEKGKICLEYGRFRILVGENDFVVGNDGTIYGSDAERQVSEPIGGENLVSFGDEKGSYHYVQSNVRGTGAAHVVFSRRDGFSSKREELQAGTVFIGRGLPINVMLHIS